MGFFSKIFAGLRGILQRAVSLLIPFVGKARDMEQWSVGLQWLVRLILLGAIYGGLWYVSHRFEIGARLVANRQIGGIGLQDFWLPTLVILSIGLLWIAWWVWQLLRPEEVAAEFPDIKLAWEEGIQALGLAGIDLTEVPLFLVIGSPAGGQDAFFSATQLQLTVKRVPQRLDAPIFVYGNREAVFVTCPGACILGRHAANLRGEGGDSSEQRGAFAAEETGEEDEFKTLQAKGRHKEMQAVFARAEAEGRGLNQLTAQEKEELAQLLGETDQQGQSKSKKRINLARSPAEVAQLTARLRYLCRLIVRYRTPFCTVNGLLLLVPFAGTETEEDANQTGLFCQQDLKNVRQVLQVECPLLALFADLETVPGYRDFVERFPQNELVRRLGQRLPLLPDLGDKESVPELAERAAQWLCNSLVPSYIYKFFRIESKGPEDFPKALRGNAQLYRFLNTMLVRGKWFGRVLNRALDIDASGPVLFGGCYLAATGRDLTRDQAFLRGVIQRLLGEQNFVAWTDEALQEEADYERWTRFGYAGVTGGLLAFGALAYFTWFA